MWQQGIITIGTIMDNYLTDKAIVFYSCLDFFEHNVLSFYVVYLVLVSEVHGILTHNFELCFSPKICSTDKALRLIREEF